MKTLTALALLLASTSALAAEDKEALHRKISEDMAQKAEKNAWTGVEEDFQELKAEKIDPTRGDYMLGAQAARTLGDAAAAKQRYEAAAALESNSEITGILEDYGSHWASITLLGKPGAPGLAPEARPFQPDRAAAIDFAADSIGRDGQFKGMLPEGRYTLSTAPFDVVGGGDGGRVDHRNVDVDPQVATQLADIPKAPTNLQKKGTPLLAGAGGTALVSGIALLVANGARSKYRADDTPFEDLDGLRGTANTMSTVAIIGGVSTVGLGVTGALISHR